MPQMIYRNVGCCGLQVSLLSLGSWITYGNQMGIDRALECMSAAYDAGVNFFDNAEAYANGEAETIMGAVLKKTGWRRSSYIVSTKFFYGLSDRDRPNERNTLNRKYLLQAIDGSLTRLALDYVDLVYCHRHDPNTPLEETVYAMDDIVRSGKALYWGTSEWPAAQIVAAWEIADQRNLHKPIVEQPRYSLFHRKRVEVEYSRVFNDLGIGATTFSPLSSGVLTGKYNDGIPKDSRGALQGHEFLHERLTRPDEIRMVKALEPIARELDCTLAQLAIAWCARNPDVSSVITGASRPAQLLENLKALEVIPKLTPDVLTRIDAIVGTPG